MITSHPLLALSSARATDGGAASPPGPGATTGSWRYDCRWRSRSMVVLAACLSATLHVGLLFCVGRSPRKVATAPVGEVLTIGLTIPAAKELEEPEPAKPDDTPTTAELPTLVPMQADLPQIPSPSDFVQQIDFSTLIERPDFSQMKMVAIPETFRGGTGKIAKSIGAIFNLADLDRIPEAVFQPPPLFPASMKRDGVECTVVVEFVVDVEGRAINAVVVESLYSGFNESAIAGVHKWRFRPGIRVGRKVNTRMRVPISFHLENRLN